MKKWTPVYGTYDCPGKIRLKADELGIVIERGRKALATTEWPGENIRLCELVGDTAPLTQEILDAIGVMANAYWMIHAGPTEGYNVVKDWLENQ